MYFPPQTLKPSQGLVAVSVLASTSISVLPTTINVVAFRLVKQLNPLDQGPPFLSEGHIG